jgi:hypothetical protein
VGLYSDSSKIDAITGDIKKRIFVGICGSFTEVNKSILDDLKNISKKTDIFTFSQLKIFHLISLL